MSPAVRAAFRCVLAIHGDLEKPSALAHGALQEFRKPPRVPRQLDLAATTPAKLKIFTERLQILTEKG